MAGAVIAHATGAIDGSFRASRFETRGKRSQS